MAENKAPKLGQMIRYRVLDNVTYPALVVVAPPMGSEKIHLAVFTPRGTWQKHTGPAKPGFDGWCLPEEEGDE